MAKFEIGKACQWKKKYYLFHWTATLLGNVCLCRSYLIILLPGLSHRWIQIQRKEWLTGAVTDWTRNIQTPREGDFGSDWDSNSWPPPMIPHQFIVSQPFPLSISGLIPLPSARPSPMLVWEMPTPGHEDPYSSRLSTSTRLPDACVTRPATDLLTGSHRETDSILAKHELN